MSLLFSLRSWIEFGHENFVSAGKFSDQVMRVEVRENFASSASSLTQGLLVGTMRYFRAKVYFKS